MSASTFSLAEVKLRFARIRNAASGKRTKAYRDSARACIAIEHWLEWFTELADHTKVNVDFAVGVNPEHDKFHNLEPRFHIRGSIVQIPGFLRYTTGDGFGTLTDLVGVGASWLSRTSASIAGVAPLPPGLSMPTSPPDTLVRFPATFNPAPDAAETHPGFQTIEAIFMGSSSLLAWAQAGKVVGPQILHRWASVINALLTDGDLASAGRPAVGPLCAFLAPPGDDDLQSMASVPESTTADAISDAGSDSGGDDAPDGAESLPLVTLPVADGDPEWSPADHRPGRPPAERDYRLVVNGIRALTAAAFLVQHEKPPRPMSALVPHPARAYRENLAAWRHAKVGVFADPIKIASTAYAERLASYGITRAQHDELGGYFFRDMCGPDTRVINHPPYSSNPKFTPRPAYTFSVNGLVAKVEGKIIEGVARGDAKLPPPGTPILILYNSDGAGHRVLSVRVACGFLMIAIFNSLGALSSLQPFWLHGGAFTAIHHSTIMASEHVGGQLEELQRAQLFGSHPVELRALCDLGEAAALYKSPSCYGTAHLMWVMTACYGYAFASRACCTACLATGVEMFSLDPRTAIVDRAVPPEVAGRPTLELPHWWGGVHAVNHGVSTFVASVAVDFPTEDEEGQRFFTGFFPGAGWNVYRDPQRVKKVAALRHAIGNRRAAGAGSASAAVPTAAGAGAGAQEHATEMAAEVSVEDLGGAEEVQAEKEAFEAGGARAVPGAKSAAGQKGWESRSVPHETRARDAKATLEDEKKWEEGATLCKKRPPLVDPTGEDDPVPMDEHWREGFAVLKARRWPARYIRSRHEAFEWRRRGRRVFRRMKVLTARTHPFRVTRERMSGVSWFAASPAELQDAFLQASEGIYFDQQASACSVASHVALYHGFDYLCDETVPFDQAIRAIEEAGDHMFSYLYYTVPALETSEALTIHGNARLVWRTLLEAAACGVPRQTGPLAARITKNRAYV